MRKVYTIIILAIPFFCFWQNSFQKFRAKSWQTFAYAVTAAEAEQFAKWDSVPVNKFVERNPVMIFNTDSVDEDKLPVGNYVLITAENIYLNARFICISDLVVLDINNKNKLQFDVRNKAGEFITDAKVFVNNAEAAYNTDSKTFWVNSNKLDDAFVKVYTPGDTLFFTLSEKDDYRARSLHQQRKHNFHSTKFYRYLNWLPSKIKQLFHHNYHHYIKLPGANGFIVFNQPKYKPLDTVRFKGYVIDKHGRQYQKNIEAHISYYSDGKNYDQLINILKPVSPGAFAGQFVLADTMPVDTDCTLTFTTNNKTQIIKNRFAIEDYVLDDIGTYTFKSEKEVYFRNDSLRFFASAKDANGLNVMDAKATLLLTTNVISNFYQDTLFIKDTLYKKEITLDADRDTKFTIAAADLPKADITIKATLTFKNSNNEQHEENRAITYKYLSRQILVTQNEDSLKAMYIEDGIEKTISGEMSFNQEVSRPVVFPVTLKIDPTASDYSFYVKDKNSQTPSTEFFTVDENYRLTFSRISSNDTLGFALENPYKIPVYYTVFSGNNIIATGKKSEATVMWQKLISDHRKLYKVRWQYIWAGKEKEGEETIGLLYKMLNIKINSNATVYPGQKDSIQIEVKDYKGKPASRVNLTAVSYNNQFNKNIKMQEPPYLAKYKRDKYLLHPGYENDDNFYLTKYYLLGKNQLWTNKFHLDTMAYYKLLFPKEKYDDEVTLLNDFVPQLSVNVVQEGVPQEIYLLYINRDLVYYNGITDSIKYAFEVMPQNIQIGIRLKDKFIQIDSLYIQAHYKHDLSFDLNNLPEHSTVIDAEKSWSTREMNLLEGCMLQLQNDYQNSNAYLWQDHRVVHLSGNNKHIAGPFYQGNITFFHPASFDINFNFEPGYLTSFSKQVVRLEKNMLFPRRNIKNTLPAIKNTSLILGDTITTHPPILYPLPEERIILRRDKDEYNFYATNKPGKGCLQFTKPKDSVYTYYILEPSDTANKRIILPGNFSNKINNIPTGVYSLLLVTDKFFAAQVDNIIIKQNGTTCVKADAARFTEDNELLRKIRLESSEYEQPISTILKSEPKSNYRAAENIIVVGPGNSSVTATVVDYRGKFPIPYVNINIKNYYKKIFTDESGNFTVKGLEPGKYTLMITSVGFAEKMADIKVGANENIKLQIFLKAQASFLQEVVVTALGVQRKRSLTGSIKSFNGKNLRLESTLQGRVAGLTVLGAGQPGANLNISLRGFASFRSDKAPLYVIDGILADELPANLNENSISDITVLKDAAALSLYGARAANGVVLITTQTKTFRQQFHDYALWQPNFFTDKLGHASIPINYPDNVTGWKTFVLAIDRDRRVGKASAFTQAYKPMIAELSMPQFLIDGDSVNIIGKSKNYTTDKYIITNEFSADGNIITSAQKPLLPNDANIESLKITNKYTDTLNASYTLKTTTGFTDGEERKIPVFKKGTEEALGNFWILQNDTVVSFTAMPGVDQLNIYAQNNTLDLMLEELEHLHSYPYYCMEQIASKLTGLALEKKIREQLKQPFKNQKEFDALLKKIQKAQLYDGGWAWWENGKTNFYITNYITNALLQFRENALVETNIRNAFLYLQNQLPNLKKANLLAALFTLSNGKHEMDYSPWINKIDVDSLTQHEQWQLISIRQQQKMNYQSALKKLVENKTSTMLGGAYWGAENYSWHSNEIATTVLAYKVLQKEPAYSNLTKSVVQYFLEKRHNGYWNNTVESATILGAILPDILSRQSDFIAPAKLSIAGDTSVSVNSFPYKLQSNRIKNVSITKSGGGLLYLTAYQHIFNAHPRAVEDKFIVHTFFQKNNENIATIKAGEKLKMIVTVNVLKDADYVQMEIPIPAGCNYASKNNNDWKVYKEFYKNKVMMFTESLSKGIHQFEIELEPRYSGTYTLNPAKISLMYYPVFYGRNEMSKVSIE